MRHSAKHIAEYVLLRGIAGVVTILPHRLALAVGWFFAALAYPFMGATRKKIAARVRQALGPERTGRDVRRIAWLAWRNLCFNGIEAARVETITLDWVKKVTDHADFRMVLDNMKDGRGVILAVPHMGNWELAGVSAQLFGARLMIIVRKQKNALTNEYLNRIRRHTGVEAFLREAHSFAGIVRGLKQGKVLAILPDLRAKADFVAVPYLGHTAQIPAGMAHFARDAGVPIIPAYVVRCGWARHRWKGYPPIWPDASLDKDADIRRMTEYVMGRFDEAVRAHPDQYFWFNKRWVLGEEPAGS